MFKKIVKRDGRIVDFDSFKITNAIFKAGQATGEFGIDIAKKLTIKVLDLATEIIKDKIPSVEEIQDIVEEVLLNSPYKKTAKAYIIYREQHARIREISTKASLDLVDQYLNQIDWRVKENSNMSFSLQGLNNYVSSEISKTYWLNSIYPPEIRKAYIEGDFHIHDLGSLSVYCVGWDLQDLLLTGFKGSEGKVESSPAKHFGSALGQIVNFFYTLQGEAAGAQAFSFDGQTPITIERNGVIESVTMEMLFNDYKHHAISVNGSEVIIGNTLYRRYSIDDADKRKYLDTRLPTEPILFQYDKIKVLTEEGFIPLCAISRHRITTKDDELLIIETEDGNILRVTRSHPMLLSNGKEKRADKLEIGDELLSFKSEIPLKEEIELEENFAYLIGFMIAEGCWGHQTKEYALISQSKNSEERRKIKDIIEKLNIPFYEQGEFNIVFGTTRMGRVIRNHLKLQEGSHRKNLPDFIFRLSKKSIGALISGLIDGDGDIDKNRVVRLHSTSYTLVMQLKQILNFIGINSTVRCTSYKNMKPHYKDSYVIKFRIEEEMLPLFKQSLKIKNFLPKVKESPCFSTKVVKVVEAKYTDEYVYDITTPNQHFLVNNIVMHNSNFDTLLAPFVRYDGLSYKDVKQAIQECLFNLNVPTRTGFQTPFTNLTFDLKVPDIYKDQPVIVGGKIHNITYSEFQKEMDMINKAFFEVMLEGDAKGRVFTFPIPTYNITKDFDWKNDILDNLWEMTGKYGIPYFSNFINSDMKPDDVRSMCCRLRLQTSELKKRGGGLFGANPLTGSIGVVTINLPRIGYLSKSKEEFKSRLNDLMELAKESLEIKRKVIEKFTEQGLYPYSKFYLRNVKKRFGKYWVNHFSTIGIVGMNEACLNLFGKDIGSDEGIDFAIEILEFMREKLIKFQETTGNNYNLEATPAEGTSYRLARIDKNKYPDIIVANEAEYKKGAEPFYTNSTHLPVNYTDDIFELLEKQDKLQSLYTGGTVVHIFVGERINSKEGIKKLVKTICENFTLPYFTITPTFSICPKDGYLNGEVYNCPKCGSSTEIYSRIVGYLRPVSQWNKGKFEEFKIRKTFKFQ
ncbi:MAG: ribonucleoside triphosphate reductase [Candidatus Ratteibacteria bacterium]